MAPNRSQSKKANTTVISLSAEELASAESQLADLMDTQLPLSRIKKIYKLDPDTHMINQEATKMLTKATELFVAELAKHAYTQAVLEKRKTIQAKDIDRVIASNWMFSFLEDALDGWPEHEVAHRNKKDKLPTTTEEDEEELEDTSPIEDGVTEEEQAAVEDVEMTDTVAIQKEVEPEEATPITEIEASGDVEAEARDATTDIVDSDSEEEDATEEQEAIEIEEDE